MSYDELSELQGLAKHIEPGDVELLEAAGVPEFDERTEWDTEEMQKVFKVEGFALGYCIVTRRSDGQRGTLDFDHAPRRYYNFVEA
jgi:hypothetical protein